MNVARYIDSVVLALSDYVDVNVSAQYAVDAAKPLKSLIEQLNANNQLLQSGSDGTGLPVTPNYTTTTIRYKRRKGQPTNRVTLKDTGDFHESITAVFNGSEIELIATDPKTGKLVQKYGKDILGLDDKSIATLLDKLRPLFTNEFRKTIADAQFDN